MAELRRRRAKVAVKARRELDLMELAWQKALTACLLALRAHQARVPAAPASKWGNAL